MAHSQPVAFQAGLGCSYTTTACGTVVTEAGQPTDWKDHLAFSWKSLPSPAQGGYQAGQLRRIWWGCQEALKFSAGLQVTRKRCFWKVCMEDEAAALLGSDKVPCSPQPSSGLARLQMNEQERQPPLCPFLPTQSKPPDWCRVRTAGPWRDWLTSPAYRQVSLSYKNLSKMWIPQLQSVKAWPPSPPKIREMGKHGD